MPSEYKNRLLKELRDQQVRFAPRDKKLEQMERAENLFHELEQNQSYPYKFLCFRITDYRPEFHAEELISGGDARNDVLLFIGDLAETVVLPVEQTDKKVWMIDELSERFHVSTKTVSRWRKLGLFSRRFFINGKKRVGFFDSTVNDFIQRNPNLIKRGEQFSQLTDSERVEILTQAKNLSDSGASPTEVARKIAERTGRSTETIRYILKTFDESHLANALFPNRNSPLDEESRRQIYHAFRCGETIEELVRRFHRTKGSIYRIIGQFRIREIMDMQLDYIDHPDFITVETSGQEKIYLAPLSSLEQGKTKNQRKTQLAEQKPEDNEIGSEVFQESEEPIDVDSFPPYLAQLYTIPPLTRKQEIHLFRKMNYLKFKANKLRQSLHVENPRATTMKKIETYHAQATKAKNAIIASNLRLVISIAQKHISPYLGFPDLVSEGNLALLRAIEQFDYSRGNKFSTYAAWAMMKNYATMIPNEQNNQDRLQTNEPAGLSWPRAIDLFGHASGYDIGEFQNSIDFLARD